MLRDSTPTGSLLLDSLSGETALRPFTDTVTRNPALDAIDKKLQALEAQGCWNSERNSWFHSPELALDMSLAAITEIQLESVLLKQHLRPQEAQRDLSFLKLSEAYDQDTGLYHFNSTSRDTVSVQDQLLGAVVCTGIDSEKAHRQYFAIKSGPGYTHELAAWHLYLMKSGGTPSTSTLRHDADCSFLQVVLEHQFSPVEAIRLYSSLKDGPLFDHKSGYWYSSCPLNKEPETPNKFITRTQLLNVFALSRIHPEEAVKTFHELINSSFFDHTSEHWLESVTPDGVSIDTHGSIETNLLGLAVEAELAQYTTAEITEEIALPNFRAF